MSSRLVSGVRVQSRIVNTIVNGGGGSGTVVADGVTIQGDGSAVSPLAVISGVYDSIGSAAAALAAANLYTDSAVGTKQDTLVSGTNIKTINGNTLLGSGDLVINTSTVWGGITGTLSDQLDLQAALNGKLSTGLAYLLASGGALSGPNTITGTTTNILKYVFDGLNTTHVDGAGHWLANLTAAASGLQQISPATVWEGQGWKTNATAASQSVKCRVNMLPIQGAANPTGSLNFAFSINGAAYSSDIFQIRSGLTVPIILDGVGFSINNGGISLSSAAPITNTLVFGTNGTISSAGLICSSGNGGVTLGTSLSYVYSPASGSVSATTLGVATNFAPTSIYSGGTFRSILVNPTYNNVGTNTAIGIDFNPTRTNVTGLTEYGILIRPSAALSGFGGITAPTALVHIGASTTARASLCVPHGTAPSSPVNGDIWTDTSGMYVRINGVTKTITLT